ncbi:MAG: two component transcriptional regulator, winged helix family protein [Parcubacteria group bacterium Athens1014_10]|nr:MAG: two component transcriptional regulator, winged helix family protein [Parcubacteria group bacterium Athens1014_10]
MPKQNQTKILIIEDDQFLRELCEKKLKKEGFNVLTAIDGKSGLEKIIEEKPDLVLLDIVLPMMDGFEVLKRIRQQNDMEIITIPIIILSNLGQENDLEKAKKLGANDYLIKAQFTTDEITEKIKKNLKNKNKVV